MKLLSHGRRERALRVGVFAAAIVSAWWVFTTYLSAAKARALLLEDLNTP